MSGIQEKLEHFNEVILKDAIAQRDRIMERTRAEIEERLGMEKKRFQEQADESLKKEITQAENEKNNIISNAIMESRLQLIKAREAMLDTVYAEVREALRNFVVKDQYLSYLRQLIIQSCTIAGEGKLTVYVSSYDLERFASDFKNLSGELPEGTVFEGVEDDIIGGCRVHNRDKDIVVNNTLSEKLRAGMDNFFEICDLRID
ncbi:MAG: V-type ATP synthase subunit E [Clostridia bacterium]|nr:V-type ATP synthase subunit E [Clostridia bacterium]